MDGVDRGCRRSTGQWLEKLARLLCSSQVLLPPQSSEDRVTRTLSLPSTAFLMFVFTLEMPK